MPTGPENLGIAFVDEQYVPIADARIPVTDLGMTRGDSTYDVVHVRNGRFFRLDDHLDRFEQSMRALRLDPGRGRREIEDVLHGCVSRAGLRDAYVSMTCTRGRQGVPGGRDLRTTRHRFYAYAVPFVWVQTPEQQERGASLWVSDRPRIPAASVDQRVKNHHWLDIETAQLDAYDHDAELVALRDAEGGVTEGAGYNLFAHVDGRWVTPDHGVLHGITRRTVIELLEGDREPVEQRRLDADELRRADEVVVTSTAGGVMPVTVVDGRAVGRGTPGDRTRRLRDRYWALHDDDAFSTAVRPHSRERRA